MFGSDLLTTARVGIANRRRTQKQKSLRQKLYLSLIVMMVGMAAVTVSVTMLARVGMPTFDPQPFAEYADIFPGQTREMIIERGFFCYSDSFARQDEICTFLPKDGLFKLISITIQENVVVRTGFLMRDHALKVGDLPGAWGRPHAQITSPYIKLDWPSSGTNIEARITGIQFSFLSPVVYLSISHS